jgi:hypothetical protein
MFPNLQQLAFVTSCIMNESIDLGCVRCTYGLSHPEYSKLQATPLPHRTLPDWVISNHPGTRSADIQ